MKTFQQFMEAQVQVDTLKKMVSNLRFLMSLNQTHLDSRATTPEGAQEIRRITGWMLQHVRALQALDQNNPGQLARNAQNILRYVYDLLAHVMPVYQKHIPNDIPPTLTTLDQLYRQAVT
jgi:hypothetical protein